MNILSLVLKFLFLLFVFLFQIKDQIKTLISSVLNDEIMSDVFKFELAYDDVIMKVKSRLCSKDNCANVDIG
jgi:hypothetical protein